MDEAFIDFARSERFCEEDQWWRIGMITREGVMIKGVDPLQGSWMGELLAMESCENTLCVLTSRMEMHVHDMEQELVRELPLMLSRVMDERSVYAKGRYMIPIDTLGCLVYLINEWVHYSRYFQKVVLWNRINVHLLALILTAGNLVK